VIEAKIFFLMFVWPPGQADEKPLWLNEFYESIENCEENAVKLKAKFVMEYGSDARIKYQCFFADDRLVK